MLNPDELPINERKGAFGVAYLRAMAAVAGYGAALPEPDFDSVDLIITSQLGKRRRLEFQVKCTASAATDDPVFAFELKRKNYDDLRIDTINPRLLLVVEVPENVDTWIWQNKRRTQLRRCGYWLSLRGLPDSPNSTSITVNIPRSNLLTPQALADLMLRDWGLVP